MQLLDSNLSALRRPGPRAAFTSVRTGLSIAFTNASTYPNGGSASSYLWDFGDGSTSTSASPTRVYAATGRYTVTLRVIDSLGRSGVARSIVVPTVVNRDGPDNWYVPLSAANYTTLGLAPPDYMWLCGEASGNLASTIGSLSLTKNGSSETYRNAVPGWSRLFLGLSGVNGSGWRTASALLDLSLNQSFAMFALAGNEPQTTGTRSLALMAGTTPEQFSFTSSAPSSVARVAINGTNQSGVVDYGPGGMNNIHQCLLYRNCAAGVAGAETDRESIKHAQMSTAARTGQIKGIATTSSGTVPVCRIGYLAYWLGVNAERDWRAFLTALRG